MGYIVRMLHEDDGTIYYCLKPGAKGRGGSDTTDVLKAFVFATQEEALSEMHEHWVDGAEVVDVESVLEKLAKVADA